MNVVRRLRSRPFFIRLLHWEYWSFHTIYIWIYPVWIWLCLRARSFFFFAAANPRIRNGGFLNESKREISDTIPSHLHPATMFFSLPSNGDVVLHQLHRGGMAFPLIGKPDIGGRGRGVKVLMNAQDVKEYVQHAFLDFHIQEFVPWKHEVGIFYYRYPGEQTGHISGIVRKEFMGVTGDGVHTVRQLLCKNERALLHLASLEKAHAGMMETILPAGEHRVLVPYGNHARGAKFIDDSALADEELTRLMDDICRQMPDFYFGRLDIRFNTWEELKRGEKFSIIEVNGAGSEPTHIYDPGHSLFFAWKEIIRHWFILWRISRLNHQRGYRYLSLREGTAMFRENRHWSEKLEAMTE